MKLNLSLDLLKIVEYFRRESQKKSRGGIEGYLDRVARDANSLATVWDTIITDLVEKGEVNFYDHESVCRVLEGLAGPNKPYFLRLELFYQDITQALGGRIGFDDQDLIILHVSRLLHTRNLTLAECRSLLERTRANLFLAQDNDLQGFRDLLRLPLALHKEAAAIEVLVAHIKTKL